KAFHVSVVSALKGSMVNTSPAFWRDAIGDHNSSGNNTLFIIYDLFVQRIYPYERILFFKRIVAKLFNLLVQPLIDLENLGCKDFLILSSLAKHSIFLVDIPLIYASLTIEINAFSLRHFLVMKKGK
ncbi:MAG: hypothetical protein L3J44_09755, partial [Campylobacteraceae bacterium]|nr:hypothetical protein [Campylobacteraceae bacterium]